MWGSAVARTRGKSTTLAVFLSQADLTWILESIYCRCKSLIILQTGSLARYVQRSGIMKQFQPQWAVQEFTYRAPGGFGRRPVSTRRGGGQIACCERLLRAAQQGFLLTGAVFMNQFIHSLYKVGAQVEMFLVVVDFCCRTEDTTH